MGQRRVSTLIARKPSGLGLNSITTLAGSPAEVLHEVIWSYHLSSLPKGRLGGPMRISRVGGTSRKARLSTLAFLTAGGLLLSACGGSESTDGTADSSDDQSATASDSAAASSSDDCTNLNVLFPQTHAGASEQLKAGFESVNPGITVTTTLIPYDEVQAAATLDVQSGAGNYDVLDMWYVSLGALVEDGIIQPLDDLMENPEVNAPDFISSIFDAYSLVDGSRYGLPFDGDTHVLFYNKEILDRNGIQPPSTWAEYADAVRKITEAEAANGVYGAALMAQQAPIIIASTYANRLAGFGGGFLDDSGAPTLDTPEAISAAQAMLEVAEYSLPTPSETAFDEALAAFLGGNVGFMEFWTDLGVFAENPEQSEIVGKWGVVELPVGGSATSSLAALNAGFAMAVSTATKCPELAKDFVVYATSQPVNLELITTTGSGIDPSRQSTLMAPEYIEFAPQVQAVAQNSLDGALTWPTVPEAPQLMQALADELANMIIGRTSPEEAMKSVNERWISILG